MFSFLMILLFSSATRGLSQEFEGNAIIGQDAIFSQILNQNDLENEQLVQSGPINYIRDTRQAEEGSGDEETEQNESPPEVTSNNNETKIDEEESTSDAIIEEKIPIVDDANGEENTESTLKPQEESDQSEHQTESQENASIASAVPLNVPDESTDINEVTEENLKAPAVSDIPKNNEAAPINVHSRRLDVSRKVEPPSETNNKHLDEHKDHAEMINNENEKNNETGQLRAGVNENNGDSTAQSGAAGTNILIILVVVVIVAGAGCFGYKYCKNRPVEVNTESLNHGTELKEIKIDQQRNDAKQAPTTSAETKPLLEENKNANSAEQNDTARESKDDNKPSENVIDENTPCNGKINDN